MELFHNGTNTAAPGTNAGTYGIDALHGGTDSHLAAGTGFTGNIADLHLTLGNFGGFQLKQPADHIGMGPGNMDQRTAVGLVNFQNIDPDLVAFGVGFTGNLLGGAQNSIGLLVALADTDKHIAGDGIDPQHGAGEQLLGFAGVGFIHHAALGFPDALDHHLLGGLGSNAAELLDVDGNSHGVANLQVGVLQPGGINVDFQGDVGQFVNDGLDLVHGQALFTDVDHNVFTGDVAMILPVLAVGVGQRLLQTLHHVINRNALDLFQLAQACEDLSTNVYLRCFGLLFGIFSGCHFSILLIRIRREDAPGRLRIFQR